MEKVEHALKTCSFVSVDRSFTIKLGLSQSLMLQEETTKLNVTLKGYPKKFWGLFGKIAHKTQQITPYQPKKGG